jgi:L-rhamnose mutarotase
MEHLAMVYRLRPGKKEEYIRAHREIWPEIVDLLRRGTVQEMRIFSRGDLLFCFAAMESVQAYDAACASDPACRRWDAWMAQLLDRPFDAAEPGIFARLEEVWHFNAQEE